MPTKVCVFCAQVEQQTSPHTFIKLIDRNNNHNPHPHHLVYLLRSTIPSRATLLRNTLSFSGHRRFNQLRNSEGKIYICCLLAPSLLGSPLCAGSHSSSSRNQSRTPLKSNKLESFRSPPTGPPSRMRQQSRTPLGSMAPPTSRHTDSVRIEYQQQSIPIDIVICCA